MKIRETTRGTVRILYVAGELDNINCQEFAQRMTTLINSDVQQILLNLEELSYLNSSGLRVMLHAENALRERGGKLLLCSATGLVQRVIKLVGFDKILKVYPTEAEALRHFEADSADEDDEWDESNSPS